MRIKLVSNDPQNDPLTSLPNLPETMSEYFLPNCERSFHFTYDFEYLEQRYIGNDCSTCWLDVIAYANCVARPVSDRPLLALVYMLEGSVKGILEGYGEVSIQQGHAYLFYVPANTAHIANFKKGHYRLVYCAIAETYLEDLVKDYPGIAELLNMFAAKSPNGLVAKPITIEDTALHQMWLIQQCNESEAFQQSHLKARCVDLILDYVRQVKLKKPYHKASRYSTAIKKEKILTAKKIIDENENGKINIADIAKSVGLNKSVLKNLFKRTFNITIGQYQVKSRLTRACKLLEETDMQVVEIALIVGYEDDSSLTRLFNQRMKMTPQQYRIKSRDK